MNFFSMPLTVYPCNIFSNVALMGLSVEIDKMKAVSIDGYKTLKRRENMHHCVGYNCIK